MSSFNNTLRKRLHLKGDQVLPNTGHAEVDVLLEQYRTTDADLRKLHKSLTEYFDSVRSLNMKSASVTQSFVNVYAGEQASQEALQAFESSRQQADKEIPERLLELAQSHVLEPLGAMLQELERLKSDVTTFKDKQQSFVHYVHKVDKLEEERNKKQADQKPIKSKDVDRLTRNQTKLADIQLERDNLCSTLVHSLKHLEQSKTEKLLPVFKATRQFQQELFKQTSNVLNGSSNKLEFVSMRDESNENVRHNTTSYADANTSSFPYADMGHTSTAYGGSTSSYATTGATKPPVPRSSRPSPPSRNNQSTFQSPNAPPQLKPRPPRR